MDLSAHPRLKRSLLVVTGVIFLFGIALLYHPFRSTVRATVQTGIAHLYLTPSTPFPQIPTDDLSALQQQLISFSRQEYAKHPVSYDANVLTYTAGSKEPWCADYISWIYQQVDRPFTNPNSGSWRIPGVYTMQEYFQSEGRYKQAGSYVPQTGDVAIYHRGQGHVALVLSVQNGTMTTIGGNENGHLRLNTQSYTANPDGLGGFGVGQYE